MAANKTQLTKASVDAYLNKIADDGRRKDCFSVLRIMQQVSGAEPRMWGASIVGFGSYHYEYASGRTGDCPIVGFAPRKQELTLYIMTGMDKHAALLRKLGKYKSRKSCLYIKRLSDVDVAVLKRLISASVKEMKKKHA